MMPGAAPLDSAPGPRLLCGVVLCLLGAGVVHAEVLQSPRHLIKAKGGKAALQCSPDSGHDTVYWYQQAEDQSLQFLISYFQESERDKGSIPGRFSARQFSDYHSELNMSALELRDSALYLCASSWGGAGSQDTQYFGAGTRLSVLEDLSKVTPPTVNVFEPSEAEIAQKQKATLVCLATGFYPDHVELTWWVNGKKVHSGVSTDPQPYHEYPNVSDSTYCLSSRLRVSAAFWHNPRNHFRCQVQFFGLEEEDEWAYDKAKPVTQNISAEMQGRADCGITSATYQQGVLSATIFYEILLGKATLYAVLVSILVLMATVKKKNP